jgi:integrase
MFTALLRANARRARPLAPATFQRIREVLRAALNGAIRRGLITQNPARWVEVPTTRRPQAVVWTDAQVAVWRATGQRPPVAVWTAAQAAAFLAHVRGHVLYPLFHIAALLGLRRGEVIGLRWSDVDFATSTQTICRQLHAEWEAATGGVVADGWVFGHGDGMHWSPSYVSHTFRRLIREADLPPVRFHDLRHGAASLSLAAGNDLKSVQALLGHASIVLTANTYTSVLPCLAHQAAEATAELVRRAGRDHWQRPSGHTHPKKRRTTARQRRGNQAQPSTGHGDCPVSRWPHLGPTDRQRPPARSSETREPAGGHRYRQVHLTRHNPNSSVLVEGPEIAIRPVGTRRVASGVTQTSSAGGDV